MSHAFRVGDRVGVLLGRRRVTGTITEDRGAVGYRGRHLYEVLVPMDPFEPTAFELAEDEMEPVDELTEPVAALDQEKVKTYLIHGGLISILRSNIPGGPARPRVWLRPDTLGNVTHTFAEERGVVGGGLVPAMAVHGDKVSTPKRDEVLSLLQSFDLDRPEAEKIVAAVGTAP